MNHLYAWHSNTTAPSLIKPLSALSAALLLNGCAGTAANIIIPESLKAPCVSTVNVENAQTVGDLGKAIIQGDGDLRVCEARKSAVVAIAESQNRRWFEFWR